MDEDDINDLIGNLNKDSKINDNILDKAAPLIKEALAQIKKGFSAQIKNSLGDATKQLAKDLSGDSPDVKRAVATFVGSIEEITKDAMATVATSIFGPEFTKKAEENASKASGAIKGAFRKVAQGAGIVVPVDFNISDPKAIESMLTGVGDVAAVAGGFLLAEGFDKTEKSIKVANDRVTALIGNLNGYRTAAGEISKVQINPFESSIDIANSANAAGRDSALAFQKAFAKEAINLRLRLGISAEDATAELKAVYSGLENYGAQLEGIKIKAKIGGTDTFINGAEAIAMAARATGIDIQTMTTTFNKLTFTMGAGGEKAVQSIETIAKAAANTLLPVSKFHAEVMAAAGQFELFGDNTEEAAAMLDRFISKAAPNRVGASVQAFQKVAAGIASMTDEMKAFVGMGTELAGGGGAIESIVRLDAALQSGDKDALQGIFDEAIARIEELSGAPVMTLEEAVSSGQEETFYQQTKMLEQMGLSKGSAQASDIFAASKRGAIDVETIRAQGGPGLGTAAVQKAQFGRGAFDIAQQQAGAAADLARYNAAYSEGTVKIMDTSKKLAEGFLDLGGTVAGTESAIKALSLFAEKTTADRPAAASPAEAKEDAAAKTAGLAAREKREATRDAQTTSMREGNAALGVVQATVTEEITKSTDTVIAATTAAADKVISTLTAPDQAGSASRGGGLGAIDAAAKEISAAAEKISGLKLQIEFKGEAKDWIKAAAVDAANQVLDYTNGGVRPYSTGVRPRP